MRIIRSGIIFFCVLFLLSCASMQDDIYIDSVSGSAEVLVYEERFAEIDAFYFSHDEAIKDKSVEQKSEVLLKELELALSNRGLKNAVVARLYAIAGCLAFDLGNKSLAKSYHDSSFAAFKGDARSLILARRLGIEKKFDDKIKLFSDKSILLLEKALDYYSDCEYAKALANFDEAFLSLQPFYRHYYGPLREKSWNLRDASGETAKLLSMEQITVLQMIKITNLNPELLFNYTVGKNLSEKELYNKIAGSGLLNPASQGINVENVVSKETLVTKQIAARFLWNLYNQRKNTPQNLVKYSSQFKERRLRSPVGDVKIDSPDFDAVLGCVENEIMHLEDGIDFGAEKEVSGAEFDESVRKIK